MRSRIHMSLSVRGALRNRAYLPNTDWTLVGSMIDPATGRKLKSHEIFDLLCDALANGQEVLPMGECNDFDPKTGCRGHPYDGDATKIIQPGRHDRGYAHV